MYITVGRKDGMCGHKHETFGEAQACLTKYQNERRKANKISDRVVLECDSIEQLEEELELI